MKKVLAFAGSNHSKSINYQLLEFTTSLLSDVDIQLLDIRDWDVPMYSIDMDPDQTPKHITQLIDLIESHDAFVIASPEHNGGNPAFLKNILDWLSRRSDKVFSEKPVFLLSTSPGRGGGANNLKSLMHTLPYQGATIAANYSLPSFTDNFKDGKVLGAHLEELKEAVNTFEKAVKG